jgi:hypothetical protein
MNGGQLGPTFDQPVHQVFGAGLFMDGERAGETQAWNRRELRGAGNALQLREGIQAGVGDLLRDRRQ